MTQKEEKELQKWESAREYQKFAERHGFSSETQKSIPDLVGLSEEDKKLFQATIKNKKP
jgi:hypothetical protein